MARPRKVVEVESVGAPMPEHDTRDAQAEGVSVEVDGNEVAAEETPATDVPDVSVPSKPSDDKPVDEDEAVSAEENAHTDEAPSNEVLFSEVGLTVHVMMNPVPVKDTFTGTEMYDVKAQVLAPGDSIPLTDLPPYLVEDLRAGRVAGAKIVTPEEAQRLSEEAARIRQLASNTVGVESDMVTEVLSPVG